MTRKLNNVFLRGCILVLFCRLTVNDLWATPLIFLTFASELQVRQILTPHRAVVDAARIRLRPSVMTTATTIIGFLPLGLNLQEGGDMLQPMVVGTLVD